MKERLLDLIKLGLLHLLPGFGFIYLVAMSFPWQIAMAPANTMDLTAIGTPILVVLLTHLRVHEIIVAALPIATWAALAAFLSYLPPLLASVAILMISAWAFTVATAWRRGSLDQISDPDQFDIAEN